MKILKKINKGLVLTIIVIVVLSIYLISIEIKRNAEKPEIEKTCREYISILESYLKTPNEINKLYTEEEIQSNRNEIKEKAVEKQLTNLEQDLKQTMIDNDKAIDIQKKTIETYLQELCNNSSEAVTSYNKEITQIIKYKFEDDQVIVTFNTKTEKEIKYLSQDEQTGEYTEEVRKETEKSNNETITLKQNNGKWEVVYSDLQYSQAKAMTDMITMTTIAQ